MPEFSPPKILRGTLPAERSRPVSVELTRAAVQLGADLVTIAAGSTGTARRVRTRVELWQRGDRNGRHRVLGRSYVWVDPAAARALVHELRGAMAAVGCRADAETSP